MTGAAMTTADETIVSTWSERNQRWLAERIAFWREQLSRRSAEGVSAQFPPETAAHDFQPATLHVRELFGLSAFETELLVLSAGIEITPPSVPPSPRCRASRPATACDSISRSPCRCFRSRTGMRSRRQVRFVIGCSSTSIRHQASRSPACASTSASSIT